jgi:hypothetical protein
MNFLSISWGVSRGVDSYGYNICRLDSRASGKRYRTCGGGYDMLGTVLGQYLENEHSEELTQLVNDLMRDPANYKDAGYQVAGYIKFNNLYGMTYNLKTRKISLDGGCGTSSMQTIGEAIGLEFQWVGNRKGNTIGYIIDRKG